MLEDKEIVSSKILEAEGHLKKLIKAMKIVDLLENGELHDQLTTWIETEKTLTWLISRFKQIGVINEK
jgi:spore coat protein CotH